MKSILGCICLSAILLGCTTTKIREVPASPIFPFVQSYSRPPIINVVTNSTGHLDYIVSDEFIINALLYKDYSDRVMKWKTVNSIP